MAGSRRWAVTAATTLTLGVLVPPGTEAVAEEVQGPSGLSDPVEVTFLTTPDGEPLRNPVDVNESGEIAAVTVGAAGLEHNAVVWDDGVVTAVSPVSTRADPRDLSEQGRVVGVAVDLTGGLPALRPFSWSDGNWSLLPTDSVLGMAHEVNDAGQVLGSLTSPPQYQPEEVAVWDGGQRLSPPAGADVVGLPGGINDDGLVAVDVEVGGATQAAVWEVGGGVTQLGTLGGPTSTVVDINQAGHVLGNSVTATGEHHAFLWRDGEMVDLGTLGGARSDGIALNDLGHVVGTSRTADGSNRAFLWRDGEMVDLGSLGGTNADPLSVPVAVNNLDQVVGISVTAAGDQHAFLWRDGEMVDLGALAGEGTSQAVALNDNSQVVGTLDGEAVMWTVSPSS